MSQDRREDRRNEAEGGISDESLRALLSSHTVPEPSEDFVSDTLLRVRLARHRVPEPTADFVDRVLVGVLAEAGPADAVEDHRDPSSQARLEPVVDLSRYAGTELDHRWSTHGVPIAMALVGLAAALLLAFLVGRSSVHPSSRSDEALVRIEDFPRQGSNRFTRSLSLVVDLVQSDLDSEDGTRQAGRGIQPAFPRPVLSLPAPPTTLIPSAVMDQYVDGETLKSLGLTPERP